MKELTQYLILISLLIGSSVMLLNFVMPMMASVVFCIAMAIVLIKIAKAVSKP
jgi:hypothetical protein